MVIVFQFTLTDIRSFGNYKLLTRPQWLTPNFDKEFVRGNGKISRNSDNQITTRLGKINIRENYVCRINRGVKMTKRLVIPELNNLVISSWFNHYFYDGEVLSKFEFCFDTNVRNLQYDYAQLQLILGRILDMTIFIRNKEFGYTPCKFSHLEKALKELHLISTTSVKAINDRHKKSIFDCAPQIFISLNKDEDFVYTTKQIQKIPVKDAASSALYCWFERIRNREFKVWVLRNCINFRNKKLVTLKNGILRIHAENECVRNVIQAIREKKISSRISTERSDALQLLLMDKIGSISLTYKKIDAIEERSDEIELFIKETYISVYPDDINGLREGMNKLKFRRQIAERVIKYERNDINTIAVEFRKWQKKYKQKYGRDYDFDADPLGISELKSLSSSVAKDHPVDLSQFKKVTPDNIIEVVGTICSKFKKLIEDNGLAVLLYDGNKKKRHEQHPQLMFYAIADSYCNSNKLDLNREVNAGSGALDFKISSGNAKVSVEMKYSSNAKIEEGYTKQLAAYNAAEGIPDHQSFYLIIRIDTRADHKIEALQQLIRQRTEKGERSARLIVVDGMIKPSASKR